MEASFILGKSWHDQDILAAVERFIRATLGSSRGISTYLFSLLAAV